MTDESTTWHRRIVACPRCDGSGWGNVGRRSCRTCAGGGTVVLGERCQGEGCPFCPKAELEPRIGTERPAGRPQ